MGRRALGALGGGAQGFLPLWLEDSPFPPSRVGMEAIWLWRGNPGPTKTLGTIPRVGGRSLFPAAQWVCQDLSLRHLPLSKAGTCGTMQLPQLPLLAGMGTSWQWGHSPLSPCQCLGVALPRRMAQSQGAVSPTLVARYPSHPSSLQKQDRLFLLPAGVLAHGFMLTAQGCTDCCWALPFLRGLPDLV